MEGSDNTVLGTALGAVNDGQCVSDFVVIPNPTVVATGVAVGTDRFCGLGFVNVQCKYYNSLLYYTYSLKVLLPSALGGTTE